MYSVTLKSLDLVKSPTPAFNSLAMVSPDVESKVKKKVNNANQPNKAIYCRTGTIVIPVIAFIALNHEWKIKLLASFFDDRNS